MRARRACIHLVFVCVFCVLQQVHARGRTHGLTLLEYLSPPELAVAGGGVFSESDPFGYAPLAPMRSLRVHWLPLRRIIPPMVLCRCTTHLVHERVQRDEGALPAATCMLASYSYHILPKVMPMWWSVLGLLTRTVEAAT